MERENLLHEEKTILVAEDDAATVFLLKLKLEETSIRLIHANNGREAVDLYKKHKTNIDLVLLDARMPYLDGFETAKEIKTIGLKVPIILLTSLEPTELNQNNLALFNAVFIKPIELTEINNLLYD